MSDLKADLIRYRMERAHESLEEAALMADTGHWRTCINRVYYSCFYAVSALLMKNSLSTVKHSGVLSFFNRHFVQLGLISKNHGKFYNRLFLYRQQKPGMNCQGYSYH